jgi:hypothetical protein
MDGRFARTLARRHAGCRNHELHQQDTLQDANTIMYEFTVTDPSSFTKPWTVQIPMKKSTEPVLEYACHEGNYAMEGMLGGLRAEEKDAAKK